MSEDEFPRIVRHEKKRARLDRKPSCAGCGETDIRTLQRSEGKVLCADCRLEAQGKRPFEKHHPAGARNDPFTVKMTGNEHAIFNDMQVDWPAETLMNRRKSPLLKTAASHRAAADFFRRQAEVQEEQAVLDEILEEYCRDRLGERWGEDLEEFRKRRRR